MARTNLILLVIAVICASGVIAATHQWRKLYHELEREQERARQLEIEWGQLQLEQSTWAAHVRVEKIARDGLHMRPPASDSLLTIDPVRSAK